MPGRVPFVVLALLASGSVLAGDREEAEAPGEVLLRRVPLIHPGPLDVDNRYQSTVQVIPPETVEAGAGFCSGTFIDPQLVVTAAHCVCARRKARPEDITRKVAAARDAGTGSYITRASAIQGKAIEFITTEKECATQAAVKVVIYKPPFKEGELDADTRQRYGMVKAYPDLELLYDQQNLVWSNADLAVIFLPAPLKDLELVPYRLADAEARRDDRVIISGFGYGKLKNVEPSFQERRFGENRVLSVRRLETGSVEFVAGEQMSADGKPAAHAYGGDSGGGCFKADDDTVLVGIIGASAENAQHQRFSVFTSVYSHRQWLEQQIEESRNGQAKRTSTP